VSQDIHDFIGMSVICIGVGLAGVILSFFWLRATIGEWPDKYDVFAQMNVYSVIAAFGLIMSVLFNYGGYTHSWNGHGATGGTRLQRV
jgi:hypothetical protein